MLTVADTTGIWPVYSASKRLGLHYVEIAKVGCTSITHAILLADLKDPARITGNHHRHPHFRALEKEGYTAPYVFTFVRNPIERLLSCYREKICDGRAEAICCPLGAKATFDEFAFWAASQDPKMCDRHFAPQTRALDLSGRKVDFMGRFETLNEDWKRLQQKFPALPSLPHLNSSRRRPGDKHLSGGTLALVRDFYREDFRRLGYSYSPPR